MGLVSASGRTIRGRDTEIGLLGELLDRVRSGSGGVLLIEGAAGMGKSRLIGEGAKMALRMGFAVGIGAAEPSDSVAELAPLLRTLFDGPDPPLDRVGLSSLHAAPEERYWRLQDLQCLLERAATDGPLLIFLDDVQWVDSGTVAALRVLPPRLASLPVGWVLAMRPDQGHLRSAVEYLAGQGAEMVALEPLSEVAVAQVVGDLLEAEPDEALVAMADEAGGNPFLLVELLEGLRQEALIRVDSGRATLTDTRLPERVRASMRERLSRMSGPARQLAVVAGSLARTFSMAELSEMLGLPAGSVLTPVEELIEAGILRERGDALGFQHDLIREAVRGACAPTARQALDRHAAEIMLRRGALPVEVATALAAGAGPGDEVAITTLLAAAEALAMTEPGASADLSRRALELAPERHPLRGPLVVQAAMSLHEAGRVAEGKAFADGALRALLPPEQEAEVRLSIARMLSLSPDVRAHTGRLALELPGLPDPLRARHLALLFHNLVVAGRPREAHELRADAEAGARATGDPDASFAFALASAGLSYLGDEFDRTLRQLEAAIRLGRNANDEPRQRLAEQWHSNALEVFDRFDDALRVGDEGRAAAQRAGRAWALRQCDKWRARQLFQMGRLSDATAVLEGLLIEEREQVLNTIDAAALVTLGRVALHTGDMRQAEMCEAMARVMLETGIPEVRRQASWLLALGAMARKEPGAARGYLEALGDDGIPSVLPMFPMDVADPAHLARIAVNSGAEELARAAVRISEHRARLNLRVASAAGTAAHALGLVHHDERELHNAVELLGGSPRRLAHASALEDLGRVLLEREEREEGIARLGQALERYAGSGATWDAARVRGRLRSLGVRRRIVAPTRPASGWAGLTDSELAVVQMVAQGITNREVAERLFVSPHTVSSHLRHAFTKLGVNSRVELARIASDHDRGEPETPVNGTTYRASMP